MRKILSSRPNCLLTADPYGTHTNIRIYFKLLENRIIGLHFAANGINLFSLKFFLVGSENYVISAKVTFQPFKVIQGH